MCACIAYADVCIFMHTVHPYTPANTSHMLPIHAPVRPSIPTHPHTSTPSRPAARFWTSKLDATRISGALCLLLLLDSWGGARSGAGGGLGVCAASLPAEQELASTVGARVPDVSVVVSLLDVGMRGDGDMSWEGQNRCLDAGRGGEVEEEVRAFVDMLAMFPWQSAYGISVELVLVVRDALGAEGRSGGRGIGWSKTRVGRRQRGWFSCPNKTCPRRSSEQVLAAGSWAQMWACGMSDRARTNHECVCVDVSAVRGSVQNVPGLGCLPIIRWHHAGSGRNSRESACVCVRAGVRACDQARARALVSI